MRLLFALVVVVAHANILGFGNERRSARHPDRLTAMAVAGFFVLSCFLITRTGRRTGLFRPRMAPGAAHLSRVLGLQPRSLPRAEVRKRLEDAARSYAATARQRGVWRAEAEATVHHAIHRD
jgi:hypothetical protein